MILNELTTKEYSRMTFLGIFLLFQRRALLWVTLSRDETERLGSNFFRASARVYHDFINVLDLVDIPLGGP